MHPQRTYVAGGPGRGYMHDRHTGYMSAGMMYGGGMFPHGGMMIHRGPAMIKRMEPLTKEAIKDLKKSLKGKKDMKYLEDDLKKMRVGEHNMHEMDREHLTRAQKAGGVDSLARFYSNSFETRMNPDVHPSDKGMLPSGNFWQQGEGTPTKRMLGGKPKKHSKK
jgi:hypothetical protein